MSIPSVVLDGYKIGTGSGNIALALGAGGTWDDAKILHPCAVNQGGTVYLFYTGYDGSVYKIGVATEATAGFTGIGFSKYGSNPILSPGAAGQWDETGVLDPFVIYDSDATLWKMWYRGYNGAGTHKIGYATANSATGPWTKSGSNPVLSPIQSWEGSQVLLPSVLKTSDVLAFDTTNLIEWWAMDEASGNRSGSHNGLTLTDNNTVGSAAGKVSNAADFVAASNESLSRTSEAALQTGDIDFTHAGWIYIDDLSGVNVRFVISKESNSSNREYRLDINASQFRWFVFTSGGGVAGTVTSTATLSTGTWYFIEVWHDAAANQVGMKINDGTADTAATSAAGTTTTDAVAFASYPGTYGSTVYFDGRIDEWLFLKRRLTNAEHTWLYNSGNGRAYSAVGDAPYKMLFAGNEPASANGKIGLATSSDGVSWGQYASNPVLSPTGAGWEQNSVFSPRTLVLSGGTYEMYYSGKPSSAPPVLSKCGYASSADLKSWSRGGNNPILSATRAWEDDGTSSPGEVENPNYIQVNGDDYVFYDAFFGNPATIGAVKVAAATGYQPRHGVAVFGGIAVI